MGRNRTQETRGEVYEDFGRKIKELREGLKMTQTELAKEIGISRTNLAQYESGVRKVPLNIILTFSNYFNVSVDELIGVHIKSDNEGEEHLERVVISKNPTLVKTYERWNREVGVVDFTADEMNELINFAKYLVSKRKK